MSGARNEEAQSQPTGRPGWRRQTVLLAVFTSLTLFYTGISYLLVAVFAQEHFQTKNILLWNATQFYLWAALAPLVIGLARRRPLSRENWWRTLLFHLAASLLFSLLQVTLSLGLYRWLGGIESEAMLPSLAIAVQRAGQPFALSVVVYFVVVIASYAADYYQRYREEEGRAVALEKDLALAQLRTLQMQLQPHFLFNTLHSLSDLILEDADAALRLVARLGDFLRLTLAGDTAQITSLARELEFVRAYLEIERTRFHDRLRVREEIEPGSEAGQVPNLILQPLVENAMRHGISARLGAGLLRIAARRSQDHLIIEVEDDGPGPNRAPKATGGLGLANARQRLHQLYGDDQTLTLTTGKVGGALVTLTIPYQPNGILDA